MARQILIQFLLEYKANHEGASHMILLSTNRSENVEKHRINENIITELHMHEEDIKASKSYLAIA